MDGNRFDDLTRTLAGARSRRGILRLIGLAFAAAGTIPRGADAAVCRPNGSLCRKPGECCSGACMPDATGRGRCACAAGTVACASGCCPICEVSPNGTACPGGKCFDGECCNSGPFGGICDPNVGGPLCCVGAEHCCGTECCVDCFVEDDLSDQYLCCPPQNLCPAGSTGTGACCRDGETCIETRPGAYSCVDDRRVCGGGLCDGPCCNGVCCPDGRYCSGGACVPVPTTPCNTDEECGPGLRCVGERVDFVEPTPDDPDGEFVPVPGTCCPAERACSFEQQHPEAPSDLCCAYGERCGGQGECCANAAYLACGSSSCRCSPRGPRLRR